MVRDEDPMVRPLRKKKTREGGTWLENHFGGVAWALGLIPLEEWAEVSDPPEGQEEIRRSIETMDEDHQKAVVQEIAGLLKVRAPPTDSAPAFDRGYRAHDRVMRAILLREGEGDALLHAIMEHDADSLRVLLKFPAAEILDPGFREGFEAANADLAGATKKAIYGVNN